MTSPGRSLTAFDFYALVAARRGHFALESGYHSGLWLDLDALFARPDRIQPFVVALADALRRYDVDAVCGPLRGGAFLACHVAELLGSSFWYTEPAAAATGDELYRARYRLPRAFGDAMDGTRVAIVDDVMSAGSSLRATAAELQQRGGVIVAVGALLTLGTVGERWFTEQSIPVHAVVHDDFEIWRPDDCPLCAAGMPVERMSG